MMYCALNCVPKQAYVTFVRYSINEVEKINKVVNNNAPTKSSTTLTLSQWAISVELIPLAFILPITEFECS